MNLHDLIEPTTKPPWKGTSVRLNNKAKNYAYRGVPSSICIYGVGLYTNTVDIENE